MVKIEIEKINELRMIRIGFFLLLVSIISFFILPAFSESEMLYKLGQAAFVILPLIGAAFSGAALFFSICKIGKKRWYSTTPNLLASTVLLLVFIIYLGNLKNVF